jgi:addiction module HigA family antidote
MNMHNPPHPGEFIVATYMQPYKLSCRFLAAKLDVAASTLNRVLKAQSAISPEMALRLSKSLGRSPESWLTMQHAYDLWQAKKKVQLGKVSKVKLNAA